MTKSNVDNQFSEQETQKRFDELVRAALNTRPKPLKTMGPKGVPVQEAAKERMKMRRNLLAFTTVVCWAHGATAAEIDIAYGQLRIELPYSTQVIAVKNNSPSLIKRLRVECGFFKNGQLMAAHDNFTDNLASGQTGYVEIFVMVSPVDSTKCRISRIDR
jgi:hypothetical protein